MARLVLYDFMHVKQSNIFNFVQNDGIITHDIFQLTVDGVTMMSGLNVPRSVTEAVKQELEPAPTLLLLTTERNVWGTIQNLKIATLTPVQVKHVSAT